MFNRKLILHAIYHIVVFAIIFFVFGIFVFFMVRHITYRSVDTELKENMQLLEQLDLKTTFFFSFPTENQRNSDNILTQGIRGYQDFVLTRQIKNPKIVMILRDENQNIVNQDELGKLEDYIADFNKNFNREEKTFRKIYHLEIGETYHYRGINFKLDYDGDSTDRFVQLLINVDSEKKLIENYESIIAYAVIIGIVLSIIASFILSKHTLKPLQENMEKQMEFVQNVSHEIRTPLTIIQAKQELLLQEPNAKIIDKSEEIMLTLNETKRLTKLTKDLMLLTRADSKTMKLQKEIVNIDNFIEELVKPYIEIAELQNKKMIQNLACKGDIQIDTNRIYQLMIILLDNAIKYTEEGDSIEINTWMKDNKCVIEIKDTGIGISNEGLKRIFERFYREDEARNRETGGSGLGLSIASFIVSAHGGTIKASHNTPKGTIFTIRLPK